MRGSSVMLQGAVDLPDDACRARRDSLILWEETLAAITDGRRSGAGGAPASEILTLDLAGRYQVGDGNEFACRVSEISPAGIRIRGPERGRVGKLCAVNIACVGIVEGVVVETSEHSFVTGVIASPRRLQRLAQRLSWQLRRSEEALEERRQSERVELNRVRATLKTQDGQTFSCEVFDVSDGGAALHVGSGALYFWVDQPVSLDDRPGRVLRYFPGGLVIKFD